MKHLIVEIKAKCDHPDKIRKILKSKNADFKGVDNQTDTYFKCNDGRLKLREGNIECNLIHYNRENKSGPKESHVTLYQPKRDSTLKDILKKSMGILVVVKKEREIYFIDNVKFHIDRVENLGSFVEIEAIDFTGDTEQEFLLKQCNEYLDLFNIQEDDLLSNSYSDMLLKAIP